MVKIVQSEKVPPKMQDTFASITSITDDFCRQFLNDEYAMLARYATAALCRKRPSPLERGGKESWACGIVYALGSVNFLFDKKQSPHMVTEDLCDGFGVGKSSGAAKSKQVRDILGMRQLDPHWCLPSKIGDNPLVWLISISGMVVDARHLPRPMQESAYLRGLIPYIHADK